MAPAPDNTIAVTVTNRQAWITRASDQAYTVLREYWSFSVPGARFTPAYKYNGWDGKIRLFKYGQVPAGLFRATQKDIETSLNLKFEIKYDRPEVQDFLPGIEAASEDYQYQNQCVEAMCRALRKGGGLILSATGTGKTATAAAFFSKLPYNCLFVVDQVDLLYQSQKEIEHWLKEPVGVVGDSEYQVQRVTVGTRQTLSRHVKNPKFMEWYKRVKIIVVDELHEQMNRSNFVVLEKIKPLARYGLTATLQLQKKDIRMRAYSFAGPVLFEFPVKEGMKWGVLSQGRVLQLRFGQQDPYLTRNYQHEYQTEILENPHKLQACIDIVNLLLAQKRYVIVLVERVLHVQLLSRMFEKAGIEHEVAYGNVKKEIRLQTREKFERGELQVIIANRVFKKGVNIKRVDAIIDMAEMKSKNDCIQKFGRGVRLHPDKTGLLYIDIGTGAGRFGRAAKSRARAFHQAQIPIRTVIIPSTIEAWKQVKRELDKFSQMELKL